MRVVQAAYRPCESSEAWLSSLAHEAAVHFGAGDGALAALYDIERGRAVKFLRVAGHEVAAELAEALFTLPPGSRPNCREVADVYYRQTLGAVSRTTGKLIPGYWERLRALGIREVTFVNGVDPSGRGCVLCIPSRSNLAVSPSAYVWRRVAAHLGAARRLHDLLHPRTASLEHGAEAIFDDAGRLQHAVGPARSSAAREALQAALVRIETARAHQDPQCAIALWRGLVQGRWSIVEQFDRDGRRYVLACPNDAKGAALCALSHREQQVVSYAALGKSNKLIAYSLGLSESTVGRHLARARQKLGPAAVEAAWAVLAARGAPP